MRPISNMENAVQFHRLIVRYHHKGLVLVLLWLRIKQFRISSLQPIKAMAIMFNIVRIMLQKVLHLESRSLIVISNCKKITIIENFSELILNN
jgi:hypothetical protein